VTEPVLDVAAYQARQYEAPRCWSLVSAVYAEVVGRNPNEVQTVSESMRNASRAFRLALYKTSEGLQRLAEPQNLAIVLMWPTSQRKRPHCGIYYAGKVLHATESTNLYQDLASLGDSFPIIEFWAVP
jgi:hypothetical protein